MKTKLNVNASGDSFDPPDRPIDLAMQLARHKANDLERGEIGKSLVPHLEVGENIDTGALRILADAHGETNRVFNRYGAANTDFAREIDAILDPAIEKVVEYCSINNVDLRDAMGYGILGLTNAMCVAGMRKAMKMRKKEKASSQQS